MNRPQAYAPSLDIRPLRSGDRRLWGEHDPTMIAYDGVIDSPDSEAEIDRARRAPSKSGPSITSLSLFASSSR